MGSCRVGSPNPKGIAMSLAAAHSSQRNAFDATTLERVQRSGCEARRQRLSALLVERDLGGAVLLRPIHLAYFFGLVGWRASPAAGFVGIGGSSVLAIGHSADCNFFAEDVVRFDDSYFLTKIEDRERNALSALDDHVRNAGCIGADVRLFDVDALPLTALIADMRRRKGSDEIQIISAAVAANEAGYRAVATEVRPGVLETEIFSAFRQATVAAGGDLDATLGNDFRGGSSGGRPRPVPLADGDLLPVDAGAVVRSYYSDMCRTFAVSGVRSAAQDRAFDHVMQALSRAESLVQPGVRCGELFDEISGFLNSRRDAWRFDHHLGHGIGLEPVEAPYINAGSRDVFAEGDTFTLEPGLYGSDLRAGLRLEQDYAIENGRLRRLSALPLDKFVASLAPR